MNSDSSNHELQSEEDPNQTLSKRLKMSSFRFFCEFTGTEVVGGTAGESLNRSSMLDVLFAFLCKFSGTDVVGAAAGELLNRSSMLDLLLLCLLSDSTFAPAFSFSLVASAAAKSIETNTMSIGMKYEPLS